MEEIQTTRLNKYLSEAGVCSRREADRLIEAGEVRIDGETAVVGSRVERNQLVTVHGKPVKKQEKMVLIAVNKPVGIVCTAEKREKDNIVDFIHYPTRIYPVGRLDKDSQGLILMTNNGDIVNRMMRAGNLHEKEYIVTVNQDITEEFCVGMANGVPIMDTVTRKCSVEKVSARKFRMILTQGMNRQIRKMCEYFDYRVVALKRVRIMNILLGDLKIGTYRNITEEEKTELFAMIQNSSNEPMWKKENVEWK
ncbi:MAG: 23S rRNA pseudouridine(2604) synthase RluF [Lachnospiraceae bacterium]